MFIGEHKHSIDEKGRLQLPVKWRSKLADGAVITKGFDGSLKFYPLAVWQGIAERLSALPQSQPSARAHVRQVLAGAVDVELDKLGRVIIPTYLRQYAALGKQVILAGLHNHIEIWDETVWEKYQDSIDQNSQEFTDTLKEIGI
jgi:MraZ protein